MTACSQGRPRQAASCQSNAAGSMTSLSWCTPVGLQREAGSGTRSSPSMR
jgi:hypothetical protein